ncbi:PHP domain-containing protein [Patescibacteria group bacterium]|nr:PHP domain-containing protein [Patescibacteria group bacterium]
MIIKTNFHLHTADDPKDKIPHTIYEAVDKAKEKGYGALAITCHEKVVFKKEYIEYAKQKGILLIPGIEAKIKKKHVVILGCNEEAEKIKTFQELKNYKKNNPQIFILAPHPFVWSRKSLGKKLIKNIALFDAIELTIFSNKIFDFNKKAMAVSTKYNKPLIATSDTHQLKDANRGYALINANEKTPRAIFEAIKKRQFENKMNSMGILAMMEIKIKFILKELFY